MIYSTCSKGQNWGEPQKPKKLYRFKSVIFDIFDNLAKIRKSWTYNNLLIIDLENTVNSLVNKIMFEKRPEIHFGTNLVIFLERGICFPLRKIKVTEVSQ